MDARFLLDANICIYIRRRRPPGLLARFERLKLGEAVLSVITYGELIYGVEKSQFREQATKQLAELAGLVPIMELPPQTGEFYGAIRASLEARGEIIGTTTCGLPRMLRRRDSRLSPTMNVSFGAFKD
jgi:tRNA(fMet)-specific endonuclease VapC